MRQPQSAEATSLSHLIFFLTPSLVMMNHAKRRQGACNEHKYDHLEHYRSIWGFRNGALPESDCVDVALGDKSKPEACDYKGAECHGAEGDAPLASNT